MLDISSEIYKVNLFNGKIVDDDVKGRDFVFSLVLCYDGRWCIKDVFRCVIDRWLWL